MFNHNRFPRSRGNGLDDQGGATQIVISRDIAAHGRQGPSEAAFLMESGFGGRLKSSQSRSRSKNSSRPFLRRAIETLSGIERSAEQWFRRYNGKAPEKGGELFPGGQFGTHGGPPEGSLEGCDNVLYYTLTNPFSTPLSLGGGGDCDGERAGRAAVHLGNFCCCHCFSGNNCCSHCSWGENCCSQ